MSAAAVWRAAAAPCSGPSATPSLSLGQRRGGSRGANTRTPHAPAARRVGGGAHTLNVGRISGSTAVRNGATAPTTSVGGTEAAASRAVVVDNERAARVAHDRNAAIECDV